MNMYLSVKIRGGLNTVLANITLVNLHLTLGSKPGIFYFNFIYFTFYHFTTELQQLPLHSSSNLFSCISLKGQLNMGHLSLEEVTACAGHEVLLEADNPSAQVVGNPRVILGQQLRPYLIYKKVNHVQTLVNGTKPGPSFQL
jgi:hypothetical protein